MKHISKAQKASLAILNKPENDGKFHDSFYSSNIGKLCFNDGFWDFEKRMFCDYVDKWNVVSKVYLPDFKCRVRNENDINQVYERVLNPIFDNNVEIGDYFLKFIARGLAGRIEDKQWMANVGFRNSGKSLLINFLQNTFGEYCCVSNSGNLLVKQGNNNDEASKLRWLSKSEFARLLLFSELDNKKGNIKVKIYMD